MPKLSISALYILFLFSIVSAKEQSKIEILAKSLESTEYKVYANDGVVVYYDNAVIKANKAFFDRHKKLLILENNVTFLGYKGTKEFTQHMEIETESKKVSFEKLFLSSANDIWLYTQKAHRSEGNYTLGDTVLSSCDIENPLWELRFLHAVYDADKKYMKIRGAKVYFLDIPIFYFPYLAFSTNKERTSGFLFPLLGYSGQEGLIYEQPIFWAINPSMDLELNPQVRTKRSIGMYGTYRFVDSLYSSGKIRMGYFKDKESYVQAENQKESEHYGLEFNYLSSNFLRDYKPKGYTDGLYFNMILLNDIDYLNLQKTSINSFGLTPLQESRLNYFLYNEEYYYGLNAKYFIDTRKESNKDTQQILPSLQFHKYLTQAFTDYLMYSVDIKINNYDRKVGATLKQFEVKVPIDYTLSFWDDYGHITFSEEIYYSKYFFGNEVYETDTFQYYSNIHKMKLFTDLTKNYGNFLHVLQPSLTYLYPGNESETPVAFYDLNMDQKELFTVGLPQEQYQFALSHYLYNQNMDLIFFQRFYQNYYVDIERFSDFGNEMQYTVGRWSLYNNMIYSNQYHKIRRSTSRIVFKNKDYDFSLGHSYKQVLPDRPNDIIANDYFLNFSYQVNEHIDIFGALSYSVYSASDTQWRFGGKYTRDCWSISTALREEMVPRPTGYNKEKSFYLQLSFIPFVGIGTGK